MHETKLILIGGCSRSGKSTLAKSLKSDYEKINVPCKVLSLDSWIVSVENRAPNSKVMERFECTEIVKSIQKVLARETILVPKYDFVSRKRIGKFEPFNIQKGILIVEGVIALAIPELRNLASITVFMDSDDQVRKDRLYHFYQNEKGLEFLAAKSVIEERELEEIPFVKSTQEFATFIFSH
jgi:uridine kinase